MSSNVSGSGATYGADWQQELSLLFSLFHGSLRDEEEQASNQTSESSMSSSLASNRSNKSSAEAASPAHVLPDASQHIQHLVKVLKPFLYKDSHVIKQLNNSSLLDGFLMTDTNKSPFLQTNAVTNHTPLSQFPPLSSDKMERQNVTHEIPWFNANIADSCSSNSFEYVDFTQNSIVRDAFVGVYIIVIALSLIGNAMVIYTVWRNKHMRTSTNYYIVNLALCDFLVAMFVMPLKLLEYTAPCAWQVFSHDGLCSFVSFVLPVFVFASVLTLVAISLERYYAVVYPLNAFTVSSKSRTRCILAATWIIPVVFASPYLFYRSYAFNIYSEHGSLSRLTCNDRFGDIDVAMFGEEHKDSGRFRKGFFLFLFFTIYLIPLMVIVTTCVRIAMCLLKPITTDQQESTYGMRMTKRREESKRRVAKMILAVAFAFIVCWTPFYLVSFISQVQEHSFLRHSNFLFTMLGTHLIGFLNSAINPLIYHFMSDKFRKSFRNILFRICCCLLPLVRKKRRYSWTARCDGFSTPYCGYVGSTTDSPHSYERERLHLYRPRELKTHPLGPHKHRCDPHKHQCAPAPRLPLTEGRVPHKTCTLNFATGGCERANPHRMEPPTECCCPCHDSMSQCQARTANVATREQQNNHMHDRQRSSNNNKSTSCGSDSCFEDDFEDGSSGSPEKALMENNVQKLSSRSGLRGIPMCSWCPSDNTHPMQMSDWRRPCGNTLQSDLSSVQSSVSNKPSQGNTWKKSEKQSPIKAQKQSPKNPEKQSPNKDQSNCQIFMPSIEILNKNLSRSCIVYFRSKHKLNEKSTFSKNDCEVQLSKTRSCNPLIQNGSNVENSLQQESIPISMVNHVNIKVTLGPHLNITNSTKHLLQAMKEPRKLSAKRTLSSSCDAISGLEKKDPSQLFTHNCKGSVNL